MITRPQPYRLDFTPTGVISSDEVQLGTLIESADRMFEMLFQDLEQVEGTVTDGDALLLADVIVLINAAIAAAIAGIPAAPQYEVLTNGYIGDPEILFDLGDVLMVRVF